MRGEAKGEARRVKRAETCENKPIEALSAQKRGTIAHSTGKECSQRELINQ